MGCGVNSSFVALFQGDPEKEYQPYNKCLEAVNALHCAVGWDCNPNLACSGGESLTQATNDFYLEQTRVFQASGLFRFEYD
jgi:hypothetical protein